MIRRILIISCLLAAGTIAVRWIEVQAAPLECTFCGIRFYRPGFEHMVDAEGMLVLTWRRVAQRLSTNGEWGLGDLLRYSSSSRVSTNYVVLLSNKGRIEETRELSIGLPFLFAIFCAYPVVAGIGAFRRRLKGPRMGFCVACGYNLTGLPEPRCPECGTPFDPPSPDM